MSVRKYELMVILDPSRSEEQQQEALTQLEEVITKYGGQPDSREIWGKRRLAYPIEKRRDGYYALLYFFTDSTNKVLSEVQLHCKIREEILRHLITMAVVDKSKGDPSLFKQFESSRPAYAGRPPRRDRMEGRPEPVAAAAPAPVAEESSDDNTPAETPDPDA